MTTESLFLNSLLTLNNSFNSYEDLLTWINNRNQQVTVNIVKIPFRKLDKWVFDKHTNNLRHETGKFFSINGLHVKKDTNFVTQWYQPIINQSEVGYLGIITKVFDGVLYFLMQAKIPCSPNLERLLVPAESSETAWAVVMGAACDSSDDRATVWGRSRA